MRSSLMEREGAHLRMLLHGKHHGSGHPDGKWFVVSDTLAARWEEEAWACRLLTRVEAQPHA